MNFLQQPTEQEFIDYVNATPKRVLYSSVVIDGDGIEFRAQREETNDEHIARCRDEFDDAWHAKNNRFLWYQLLKREFGDA